MLEKNINLQTHAPFAAIDKVLGYSEPDNQLIVNFRPTTMMDPTGTG
jgi:hypothetical protein